MTANVDPDEELALVEAEGPPLGTLNKLIDLAKVPGNVQATTGPCTLRVSRPLCTAYGVNVGAFSET